MAIRFFVALWIGKLTRFFLRWFGHEAGTWPGEIALRIYPSILSDFSRRSSNIILIAGTNGKTTTAKMLETMLRNNRKSVFHNESGANLDNGIVSSFLKESDWAGSIRSDYCIFEVDEATLSVVLKQMTPKIIVLLNLFRDQLDRYGEVDAIAEKWAIALQKTTATVLVNADDPYLAFIGSQLKTSVHYFGLEEPSLYQKQMQHATDTIYCPKCDSRLTFEGVYFSHLGKWSCAQCGFHRPRLVTTVTDVPLEGVYNRYNALAAVLAAKTLGIQQPSLQSFQPAFGRQETLVVSGKKVKILLSKNPTGFNESLRTVVASEQKGPILLMLNDRIPDGLDVSWIWDVDFENLSQFSYDIFVSGDRKLDMALRLKYAGVKAKVRELSEILEHSDGEILWILPTYSAMLEVRETLVGKKIL